MDILYIVGKNSKCYNLELRCSLRSIEKYGKNVGRVYVVGNCPPWLSDKVVKIPYEDCNEDTVSMLSKSQNITRKLLYAVDNSDIGEEFLVSMDDHFYIRNVDFDNYPYYVKYIMEDGRIPEYKNHSNVYAQFMSDCAKSLKKLGLPTLFFTLHRNMHVSRTAINECRPFIEDSFKNNYALEAFALIGNWMFSKGLCKPTLTRDNKLKNGSEWWKTDPRYNEVFSTADFSDGIGLYTLIEGLYDKKSKYEI